MDDIRKPQRRDYALPNHRPPAHHPHPAHHQQPHHQQPHPQPVAAQPYVQPQIGSEQPVSQPDYQAQPYYPTESVSHQPHYPPSHYSQQHQAVHQAPKLGIFKRFKRPLSLATALVLAIIAVLAATNLLKSKPPADTIPDSITRQVNFSLYFPSPMPPGFTYMKDTATFEIGQVYYKFAKGSSRVTVNEQALPKDPPDFNKMIGFAQFDAPIGKAAVGWTFSEPTAYVLAGNSTLITLNSVGKVTQQDLKTAVLNLKYIGQKPNQ